MKSVAINVAANSSHPGGRGSIYVDGTFRYVPISEDDESVEEPTFDDLGVGSMPPESARDTVVHFDPESPDWVMGRTTHMAIVTRQR